VFVLRSMDNATEGNNISIYKSNSSVHDATHMQHLQIYYVNNIRKETAWTEDKFK